MTTNNMTAPSNAELAGALELHADVGTIIPALVAKNMRLAATRLREAGELIAAFDAANATGFAYPQVVKLRAACVALSGGPVKAAFEGGDNG